MSDQSLIDNEVKAKTVFWGKLSILVVTLTELVMEATKKIKESK